LSADNNSTSLRKKIAAKFTPRIQPTSQRNNKEKTIQPQLASKGFLCPSQSNLQRRSTPSLSSSRVVKQIIPHCLRLNFMLKPPSRTLACQMLSRSRKLFLLWEQSKLIKSITLSKDPPSLNLASK